MMVCVNLLGIAQLLKPWNWIGHYHSHFLFHNDFAWYLLFITATIKNPISQRYHSIKMKEAQSKVKTVNYPGLEVCMVSNRCWYVSLENLKYAWGVLWGISGYSVETTDLQSIFLQCFYSLYSQSPPSTVNGSNL